MMKDTCECCTPGELGNQLCRNCFKVWYDSGITSAPVLAREVRWRKEEGYWPWGKSDATVAQLDALERLPLPVMNWSAS